MKQSHKTLLLWVLLILMFLAIWQFLSPGDRKQPIAFSEFVNQVHAGQVDDLCHGLAVLENCGMADR